MIPLWYCSISCNISYLHNRTSQTTRKQYNENLDHRIILVLPLSHLVPSHRIACTQPILVNSSLTDCAFLSIAYLPCFFCIHVKMIVNLLWNQVLFCHILTPSCQDISGSNRIRGSHFLLRTLSCTSCRSFLALLPPVPALQCIITVS